MQTITTIELLKLERLLVLFSYQINKKEYEVSNTRNEYLISLMENIIDVRKSKEQE